MKEVAFVTVGGYGVSYTSGTDYTGTKLSVTTCDASKPFGRQFTHHEDGTHFDTDEMAQTYALCKGYIRLWERKGW